MQVETQQRFPRPCPHYLGIPSFKMCSFPWRPYTEHPRLWGCREKLKWSLDTARWLLRRKRPQGTFLPSANQGHSISRNHSSREPCLLAQGGGATIAQVPGYQTKKLNRHEGLRGGRRQKMYLVGTDPSKAARLASQVLVASVKGCVGPADICCPPTFARMFQGALRASLSNEFLSLFSTLLS